MLFLDLDALTLFIELEGRSHHAQAIHGTRVTGESGEKKKINWVFKKLTPIVRSNGKRTKNLCQAYMTAVRGEERYLVPLGQARKCKSVF